MKTCFVCGSIYEKTYRMLGYETFFSLVDNFLKTNNIECVYSCLRNDFDYLVKEVCDTLCNSHIKYIEIIGKTNSYNHFVYLADPMADCRCPVKEEIHHNKYYATLYNWMMENCDYMLTFLEDDGDIAFYIKDFAKKKHVKVCNLASAVHKKVFITPFKRGKKQTE